MGENSIKVNLVDVEVQTFEVIPRGEYHLKVTDGEIRTSGETAKNPGAQYINWEFTVQDGEYAGRKLWAMTSLLPQALFGLKGLLQATGKFTDDQLSGDLEFEIEDVIGSDVIGVVKIKPEDKVKGYDEQNQIKAFKSMSEAGATAGASSGGGLLP
jgi:hypothetical protein